MGNQVTRVFLDTKFTGLHQKTTLISIGLVSEDGKMFYAETNDYDTTQVNPWIQEHVVDNLLIHPERTQYALVRDKEEIYRCSTTSVGYRVRRWLQDFPDTVEIWSDCLAYDWVLFCELFGGALNIPENVYYIPFDLCTLLKERGVDPDINRHNFGGPVEMPATFEGKQHNALYDAIAIRNCYDQLTQRPKKTYHFLVDGLHYSTNKLVIRRDDIAAAVRQRLGSTHLDGRKLFHNETMIHPPRLVTSSYEVALNENFQSYFFTLPTHETLG